MGHSLQQLRKRIVAWIAVFGLLVAALAPSISLALGSARGDGLVEVCTAQGSKWVRLDGSSSSSGQGSDSMPAGWNAGHCKLCCSHVNPLALAVPGDAPLLQLLQFGHELPDAFLTAPRTLAVWLSAQPRGPPRA